MRTACSRQWTTGVAALLIALASSGCNDYGMVFSSDWDSFQGTCGCPAPSGLLGSDTTVNATLCAHYGALPSLTAGELNYGCTLVGERLGRTCYGGYTADFLPPLLSSDDCYNVAPYPDGVGGMMSPLGAMSSSDEVAYGDIASTASTVTVYNDGSAVASPTPTGWLSIRGGYCPGQSCPFVIDGLRFSLPNFAVNDIDISEAVLTNIGTWDGATASDDTYAMYGTSTMSVRGKQDDVLTTRLARSYHDEVNGAFYMTERPLPAPLTGSGRFATVNGLFQVTDHISMELSIVVPLTRGAPTPLVTATAQPPCGVEPCGGTTYSATGSQTFAGDGGFNVCCNATSAPGCESPNVEARVCAADSYCCMSSWDSICVGEVTSLGAGVCGTSCYTANTAPGCAMPTVEACVCGYDSYCCESAWDLICVREVTSLACGILNYLWVDANNRQVGTGPTLDSDAVTIVAGKPSPYPVTLQLTDMSSTSNYQSHSWILAGPGYLPMLGQRYAQDGYGRVLARGFINRDAYEDLVVGSPDDATSTGTLAYGSVHAIYGGRPDLRHGEDTLWQFPTGAATDDFGTALAVGDFNGDGLDDVAASAPGRNFSGVVYIRYSNGSELSAAIPSGATAEIKGVDAPNWLAGGLRFGEALTAADVNGDGADDLVVAMPTYNGSRGAIWVYYGKMNVGIVVGVGAVHVPHIFRLEDFSAYGAVNRRFGGALAAGDLDGDDRQDVVIGASGLATGVLSVLYGTATGLSATKKLVTTASGRLGASVAVGDFNADGFADAAAGAPTYITSGYEKGAVMVYRGTAGLPGAAELYRQAAADPGGPGCRLALVGDQFGTALAIARIDGDAKDDLIVLGVSTASTANDMVFVLQTGVASPSGVLFHTPNELCFPASTFFTESAHLGTATGLTAVDVTNDGFRDIVVGSPPATLGGRVDVLPGTAGGGLSTSQKYFFQQPTIL